MSDIMMVSPFWFSLYAEAVCRYELIIFTLAYVVIYIVHYTVMDITTAITKYDRFRNMNPKNNKPVYIIIMLLSTFLIS